MSRKQTPRNISPLTVYVTEDERDQIARRAANCRLKVSSYMRTVALGIDADEPAARLLALRDSAAP